MVSRLITYNSGVYQAKAYETICNGVKYISEIKKDHTLDSDTCEVFRNGIKIN